MDILLAAIDLLTVEAIPLVSDTHKSSDFITFLKKLDEKYPKGDTIRIILDNHSAHTSKETQGYLNTISGRFGFVFTPKHGSWLDIAEIELSALSLQCLENKRIPTISALNDILKSWSTNRNSLQKGVLWHFSTADARIKLKHLYPIIQM